MGSGMQKYYTSEQTITIANGGTHSTGFQMPQNMQFIGLFIPNMTPGDINLEVTVDDGANWLPVLDTVDGNFHVFVNSGQVPCFVDISDYLRFLPEYAQVRIDSNAVQAAGRTILVLMRG